MKSIANCAYCHKQPEQLQGVSWGGPWHQVRCTNPHCTNHGTVRHLTLRKAIRLWNLRQRYQELVIEKARHADRMAYQDALAMPDFYL